MQDIDLLATTLMSINQFSNLKQSLKRISITKGSKLIYQSLDTLKGQ